MRTMTKLRRSTRGLSPIFATLILIAIAVIAGIIVYMFTSGTLAAMMGGGTAGQEKVAIQAVNPADKNSLKVYAQSTGGGAVTVNSVIMKDSAGNVYALNSTDVTGNPITSSLTTLQFDVATDGISGNIYTITLVSTAGNSFVSPSFKIP